MPGQWFYSHDGVTHGPFSNEEIREHAARKMLLENDWVWQGSQEPKDAFPAQAVLDFSNLPLISSPIPDWLEDVANVERKGPLPGPVSNKDAPEWLEDLRLWIGLELYVGEKTSLNTSASAIKTGGIPDWLEITKEKPKVLQFEKTKPSGKPEDILADKTIQETGFDLKTGQILDTEKFRRWQKASHSQQTGVTNESLFEVFRKARIAIENWVDEDNRRPLILAGDLQAIKKEPTLLAILQKTQGFGAALQEKLWHHLEFMVENRGKYYSACAK